MFNIFDIQNVPYIPPGIYAMIIALIALILLSIFHDKLKISTVTKTEYAIETITAIGLILFFFSPVY